MNTVDFENAKTYTPNTVEYGDNEREMPVMSVPAIDTISRAEIDVQIATAHRFPRSMERFVKEAMKMATYDEDTAASCFYKLPRDGKIIEGPGVRLAEIIGSTWGNMRYGARIVAEDREFIVAQGVAHDLEKNVSASLEVRRRIVKRDGKRYTSDMINTTANAACSIALRNAIFRVIPKTFVNQIYEAAKQVAIGDASTLVERRTKALDYFAKMGVMEDRILAVLGKSGIEDIGLDDLATLTGLKTAIKDGDTTVDEAFPMPVKSVLKGSAKATEKSTSEPTQESGVPDPASAQKTKADKIAALEDLQKSRNQTDEMFNGFASLILSDKITDWRKLNTNQIDVFLGVLSDNDKAIQVANDYDKAVKSGDLFDGKGE